MFDLPTITIQDKREYRCFKAFLTKNGFMMLQESIYTKIAFNSAMAELIASKIRNNKPKKGLVQMLTITEKQFGKMEILVGEVAQEYIMDDREIVIL